MADRLANLVIQHREWCLNMYVFSYIINYLFCCCYLLDALLVVTYLRLHHKTAANIILCHLGRCCLYVVIVYNDNQKLIISTEGYIVKHIKHHKQ